MFGGGLMATFFSYLTDGRRRMVEWQDRSSLHLTEVENGEPNNEIGCEVSIVLLCKIWLSQIAAIGGGVHN